MRLLKDSGNSVKVLKLEPEKTSDNDIVSFYSSSQKFYFNQFNFKISKKINHIRFRTSKTNYKLPASTHRLEDHPLFVWADVINLHWISDYIDYKRFFNKISKPIVWTLHDMLPFSGGFHYNIDNLYKIKKIEDSITHYKYKYLKNSQIKIVAPSKWLVSISMKSKAFKDFEHKHIFNPLPINTFKPLDKKFAREALNLPKNGKILLFAADNINSKRKGIDTLIKSINYLDVSDLTLVSIGRNKIKIKSKIPYLHLGLLKDEFSISLLYSAVDLSVVPSKEDNSPNSIIESFACGCPVVGFDVGGISELLCFEKLGVLVNFTNEKELASAITTALKTKYSSDFISSHAKKRFNYKLISKKYLSLYKTFFK